jgi:bifunctional N-acetylglucosamine-1-phosphate-uridyltransferase/glucosamine-1-phosphate-acetyltransferase GlmU-like protein
MQLIVPMAGLGQRFADAGYAMPKPLVDVSGLPMIVRVVRDMPACERVVFIVNGEHVRRFAIDKTLRSYFPAAQIVVTPGLTQGQACTVRLAADAIDLNDDVLVAACDATHVYDAQRFAQLRADRTTDAIVWTYRGEPRVLATPKSFGWIRMNEAGDVAAISCKQPISDQLLADRVVSGFFWFRSAQRLMAAIDDLVASNERINNEFYLDVIPNRILAAGGRVTAFDVEKYIGWGTPEDLRDYERWERYFTNLSSAGELRRAS